MAVTSAAVRTVTAGIHRHWLLGPIESNVNQCRIAPRSLTAYRDSVQRQRSYRISPCPTLQVCIFGVVQYGVFCKCVCILSVAVCTANGILRLKDRRVDSWVVIVWADSCWRDGGGFVIASLSLTFGVADLCGCLYFGGFRDVDRIAVAEFRRRSGVLAVFCTAVSGIYHQCCNEGHNI
ncbi:hypothetical protein NDU88_006395 [Pleurodeles waltl]|uniref:Uncharacterized protein n=1 Tax=Pleurodeles waltl TaxID=8319 RepID=A0AAV7MZ55_PLEWA|nr:hypothetical protein NDU88_006395 [Pleurodeles waltl]